MNDQPPATDEGAARTTAQVRHLLAEHPEARVLDVRKADARSKNGHIPGSELLDVNAQLADGNLEALLEQDLPTDTPLVFVCNTGGKCTRAAEFLRERGYDAVSVYGGMRGWQDAGGKVEKH